MSHVGSALTGLVRVDRSKFVWKMPLRSSLVILALITAFVLTGHPLEGVPVTVGALFAAIADVGEHVGRRWRTMLWTTTWVMAAGLVGEAVSDNAWSSWLRPWCSQQRVALPEPWDRERHWQEP